ncbi:glycosyltransferase family 2 protein [soil metagenome]
MAERQKLTVLIPAGNEERHIAECIASARWADEVIVVVDTASTDRTEEIAGPLADRILVHEYQNSAAQKNWAIPQASHSWILVVDADERVTPELRADVEHVLENDGPADGYRIHRLNHFAGQRIVGCGWQRDDVLRLFRRDRGKYEEKHVHAGLIFPDGKPSRVDRLNGKFLHFTFESFDQYLKKHGRYATWAGEDRAVRTGPVGLRHLALRPAWRFFRQYIMYGGFRDGLAGFIICWMAAHSVFLKYAHVWELQRKKRGMGNGK